MTIPTSAMSVATLTPTASASTISRNMLTADLDVNAGLQTGCSSITGSAETYAIGPRDRVQAIMSRPPNSPTLG
jgi:hypothetical protein